MKAWVLFLLVGCYQSHEGAPRDGSSFRDAGPLRDGQIIPRDGRVLRDGERPPDGWIVTPRDGAVRDARPRDGRVVPDDSGVPSWALGFASGDFLVVAADPTLELVDTWTFELWIRPRGDGTIAIKGDRTAGSYHFFVAYEAGEVVVGWSARREQRHLRAMVPLDRWTHIATVGVASPAFVEMNLLVDGVVVNGGLFPNDLPDSLNSSNFVFGGGFNGDIDEIRLWTVARDESSIAGAMLRRLDIVPPGMEMYLPLEERGGQVALDRALRSHDAVLGSLVMPDSNDPAWIGDGPIP